MIKKALIHDEFIRFIFIFQLNNKIDVIDENVKKNAQRANLKTAKFVKQ